VYGGNQTLVKYIGLQNPWMMKISGLVLASFSYLYLGGYEWSRVHVTATRPQVLTSIRLGIMHQ
jgi:hypothetical protein